MRLRNKKTGEIIDGCFVVCKYDDGERFSVKDKPVFDSFAELNEDWEDYAPKEPLIKDKNIRKAVRAWAEVNGINEVSYIILSDGLSIFCTDEIEIYFTFQVEGVHDDKRHTIAELCGEEE